MGTSTLEELLEVTGETPEKLAGEAAGYLIKLGDSVLEDEKEKREELRKMLSDMSDQELRETFVPDVYQKSIYRISYTKLNAKGIKLISFDIDDTFGDVGVHNFNKLIPGKKIMTHEERKKARALVEKLHNMGFTVVLLTNAGETIAKGVYKEIGADDYVFKANKPDTESFNRIMVKYGINNSQMAHVGNNIRQDVAGGNAAGVTTCLVRNRGFIMKVGKISKRAVGLRTRGHLVREELSKRRIWRKYDMCYKDDQYYQLGEAQKFSPSFKG